MPTTLNHGLPKIKKSLNSKRLYQRGHENISYLYVFRCEEFYKIGISRDPEKRLGDMRNFNPHEIKPIFYKMIDQSLSLKFEKFVHDELADYRIRGEWFVANIKTVADAIDVAAVKIRKLKISERTHRRTQRQKEMIHDNAISAINQHHMMMSEDQVFGS